MLCVPSLLETHANFGHLSTEKQHFSGFLYLPQSSCSLLLVDVDEVAHHAALDHISLSLHAYLEGKTDVMYKACKFPSGLQVQGCITAHIRVHFQQLCQAQYPEVFSLSSFL